MAVVEPAIFKPSDHQRQGTTTSTLTIAKLTNHRRILLDAFVDAGASSSIDIKVGNVTIARIFDNLAQAILISDLNHRFQKFGFLWYLSQIIPEFPFPNASQDEDITITRAAAPMRMDAYFQDIEGVDVGAKGLVGGSQAVKQLFILNLSNQAAITADGTTDLDAKSFDMPTGLSVFGDGTRIASNQKFTIYVIAANVPINVGSKATRIHLFDERIELFTSGNNEGLFVDPTIANELEFDLTPLKAFVLRTPYEFMPNRLMRPRIEVDHDGTNNLAVNTQQLFLIGTREFLGV